MLQGQRELTTVGRMLLSELAPLVNAQQGLIYQTEGKNRAPWSYSPRLPILPTGHLERVNVGEGLIGQCAAEKRRMLITDLPPDRTLPIRSGLFEAVPRNVIVLRCCSKTR